jgi:hypothetical protein
MALYKSQYPELSFYVDKERNQFSNGEYRTNDKNEIEVLDKLVDAICVDEPKQEKEAEEPTKPAPKKAPARRASAK